MAHELFNSKVDELFKDLVVQFPDVQEFKNFKSLTFMLGNIEPKKPVRMFKQYFLSKYRAQLLNKDESFFLDCDNYETEEGSEEFWHTFILKIKEMWRNLTHENKEVMWKYFHVLVVISDKCS